MSSLPCNADIEAHLGSALAAISEADDASLRAALKAIVDWQEAPLLAGMAKLSQQLGKALGELPIVDAAVGELPDACTRLDRVVDMTEQAANRTLDLVEDSKRLIDALHAPDADHAALLDALRGNLSDLALAQSYQDLTGQIIRKVAVIVRGVYEQLTAMGLPPPSTSARDQRLDPLAGAGPAVAGVDKPSASQRDADGLLSELGI